MSSSILPYRGPPRFPQPQAARQSNGKLDGNIARMAKLLRRLERMNARRIYEQELRDKFDIVPQKLNLQTGEPTHGEPFLKPVPQDQMNEWLNHFLPRQAPDMETHEFEFEYDDSNYISESVRAQESVSMKKKILNFVQCSKDWEMGNILESKTAWRPFIIKWDHLHRSDHFSYWEVSDIFLSVHPSQRDPMCLSCDPDPRFPHVQAWLHDVLPVVDDLSLTVAELSTVLALALSVIARPMFHQELIVPITVFSCSDRQLRIVQGGADFQNGKVDIRVSKLTDFSVGGISSSPESKNKLCKVLGLFCAEPGRQSHAVAASGHYL